MLSAEQKYTNKTKFINLLSTLNIDLTALTKYLAGVNFFEKPLTAQYNRAYAGGLCEQALAMYEELTKLCNLYFPNRYTNEDIIKVALFKDLIRADWYEGYYKNVKNEQTGTWEQVQAYRVREDRLTYGEMGFSSYMLARHFIEFTDEQIEAICHSSYKDAFTSDIHDIFRTYPLTALTRMAEIAVNYFESN